MGRPSKYRTEEERRAAQAEAKRRWKAKNRKKSGRYPKSWVDEARGKLRAATESLPDPNLGEDEQPEVKGAFADLPPIEVVVEESSTPTGPEDTTTGSSAESSTSASSPDAGSAPQNQESQESDQKSQTEAKIKEMMADPKLLGSWVGEMYGKLLMVGSAYAVAHGGIGLGPDFASMAGEAASFLVAKYAASAGITTEDGAWFIVVGTGGFVGWQSYTAWTRDKAEKAKLQKEEAPRAPERKEATNGHVNGAPASTPARVTPERDPAQPIRHGQVF